MPTCAIAPQTRGVRVVLGRAQAARLLHRHHLLLVGRLTLRHVVHLVDRLGGEVVRLSARLSLGHRLGSCCARGPQGTTRNVVCVRTGTAGSSLLLTLVWIVFTEVSSSRSAAIWCSGAIYSRWPARAGCEAASDAAASINLGAVLVNLAFITRGSSSGR